MRNALMIRYITTGHHIPSKVPLAMRRSLRQSKKSFLEPKRQPPPNGISIGSVICAHLTHVPTHPQRPCYIWHVQQQATSMHCMLAKRPRPRNKSKAKAMQTVHLQPSHTSTATFISELEA